MVVKCTWMLFVLLFITSFLKAQQAPDTCNKCYTQKHPLSEYAYQKMMRQHYTFTILGSQTPVSGFKVETSKPTVTLKGNIISPKDEKGILVNLELVGGLQNDVMQLFSGSDLNSYFKASIGFNKMIMRGNEAKYVMPDEFIKKMMRRKVCQYREDVAKQIDSMLVIEALESFIQRDDPKLNDIVQSVWSQAKLDPYTINGYCRYMPDDIAEKHYRKLVLDIIKSYGAVDGISDEQMRFSDFLAKLKNEKNAQVKVSKIVDDWKRMSKFKINRIYKYDLMNDNEIETYKDVWTSKRVSWINVSFAGSNSNFKLFDAAANSLSSGKSFLPSLSVSYNFFWKASLSYKYLFIRSGLVFKRVNTLVDFATFDYNKETIINVTPQEQLVSKKTGTAYIGSLKHGSGIEVPIETYWAPWSHVAIPGIYMKGQYSYGSPWINKNKISADIGLVWNVVNNDKDAKSVLTIVPYISWSNLLKEYKDQGKTQEKNLSDVFSVGVKFGIPVNLGR